MIEDFSEQLRELERELDMTDSETVRETGRRVAGLMD